jgi:RNA polymerase sigma factor (sigma-70 family)
MGPKSNATPNPSSGVRRLPHKDPSRVEFYEGLVRKTASIYTRYVEYEFDDVAAMLRIKVWQALEAYDPARSRMTVERYVFMCVKNKCKDLVDLRRRNELYIEDLTVADGQGNELRDAFESRYLSSSGDTEHVEAGTPVIPSTLTPVERDVLALLYLDYSQREAAAQLGIRRNEMERAVKAIRQKMADWRPTAAAPVPPPPLPIAA